MIEWLRSDRDTELPHVGEVRSVQLPRHVHLGKYDFLSAAVQRTPLLDPALEGAQLPILIFAWRSPLQEGENRFCLKLFLILEQIGDLCPVLCERVFPRSP